MEDAVKNSGVRAVVRAPLLHFLILGGIAFAAWAFTQGPESVYEEPARRIEVPAERIAALREGWFRKRSRPPTEAELRGLIKAHEADESFLSKPLIDAPSDEDTATGS